MRYIGIGINSSTNGIYGVQLMSVMLYDNDTNEPLYSTSKISNDSEQKQSRVNSQKDFGENTTESTTEQTTQESVAEEKTEEESTVNKENLKGAYNLALTLEESNYSVHS
ncbi:hypothetical protein A5881_000552 [Enterococcus termitis]|nr:hypothetical protein A5881_000759 [Enterococcus termitis]